MADQKQRRRVMVSPPASVDDLRRMYDEVHEDPAGVAALYVMAMLAFTRDKALGRALVRFLMTPEHTVTVREGEKALCRSVMYHLSRLERYPYLARTYVDGTSPADGYALGEPPYAVVVTRVQPVNPSRVRLYLACSGAASARPVVLQREEAGWKVREESSLYSGVVAPSSP